ncbi:tRNA endonuclease ANKZF1 [Entelurus aequoreus]|uniref:tRNA endonuclease ANKZF1 n=1 Tax=Entelurus aequoreus TaxID=161455 RepID=UPI002B1CE272|nr:tRNA endonuclease ANKZF1 [Entelurus aequoreus]XP_061925997.1 tRNA endonuclease ANKZF1 [Entelurus aequoreus]XP_061925998.1 tRNA endonuclease ANKZF1 [Entelurus aequoreus]XP_061925999.1 tRNA endonuclease ANKZF1 [Entelurus aequoreus]XP_061926001.1 tRNA endonuclease ANKZF1 [Entelurus aequoreus]
MKPAAPVTACSIFDLCSQDDVVTGLREVNCFLKQSANAEPEKLEDKGSAVVREVSDKMVCSSCRCSFINREEQMEHYKLDWHRFNLRLKISGMPPVTTEEFERKTGDGDVSSISGSESDSEEEEGSDMDHRERNCNAAGVDSANSEDASLMTARLSSKVLFQNSEGQYLSFYRCILQGKSDEEQDLASSLKSINKKTLWIILMTGGGHFAGAVFQGKEVLQHKTFHRYTVRAKRGTAQGLRDSQNRSHTPKSAGAALRRYNEAALVKDIQDLLVTWGEHLKEASAVFVRAPSYNKAIFFGGRTSPLDKKDSKIRSVPFATRRATFREVQRVHHVLSTVHVHGKDTDMSTFSNVPKKPWKKTVQPAAPPKVDQEEAQACDSSSDKEQEGEIQLVMMELTVGSQHLKEFEVQPSRQNRRKRRKQKKKEEEEDTAELRNTEMDDKDKEEDTTQRTQSKIKSRGKNNSEEKNVNLVAGDDYWEYSMRDTLFTACKVGDVDALCSLLHLSGKTLELSEGDATDVSGPLSLLNKRTDSSGFTLLHVASAAAQKAVVRLLLDAGADPTFSDIKGQTPYNVSPDKETRNVYRKYMADNPDKYDYNKARIPGPLTPEIESMKMEKKKAQKALKKQREKTQKDEKRKQELEEKEKKRFASLSDREKRALAAEKRLAQQVVASVTSLSNVKRCWQCGESLQGKTPFQYLDFSFCTPRCVQAHRKANAPSGKS